MQGLSTLPAWRVTCFVDSKCRRRGVSAAALNGALDEIAGLGGGRVESFSTTAHWPCLRESRFTWIRRLGKNHGVVEKIVPAVLNEGFTHGDESPREFQALLTNPWVDSDLAGADSVLRGRASLGQ